MKLSEAFETPVEGYEWTTTLININPGYNDDILEKCEMLNSYSRFIATIRENAKPHSDKTMDEVIDFTVTQFQDMDNEFGTFLRSHRAEVVDVCITVYDEDKVKAYLREEAIAEGLAEGISRGISLTYCELIRDGEMTMEHAAERLHLSFEEVNTLMVQLGYQIPEKNN